MTESTNDKRGDSDAFFASAEWYDQSINWSARLKRELPVLTSVFGAPKSSRLLDAGCGTAHQACALAAQGYQVVAADASGAMLELARDRAAASGASVLFVESRFEHLVANVAAGFDGVYCQGNALAAAGSLAAVEQAIEQFAACLRVGGQLFVQVINFARMRKERPCVRGPRVAMADGVEYISTRHFHFAADHCQVTNVTVWKTDVWHQRSHEGTLYAVSSDELVGLCDNHGLEIEHLWGGYDRLPFDLDGSNDLVLVATKRQT